MVKLKVKEKCISYAVGKKRAMSREKEETEQSISQLEKEVENSLTSKERKTDLQTKLESKKRELEHIIEYYTQVAIVRAKVRWYNEGEKTTKYFLGLEKRHYRQGTITQLKTGDNNVFITTDKEILDQGECFYKDLYSSKIKPDRPEVYDSFFTGENPTLLNSEGQKLCEGKLTKKECLNSLKDMAPDKSPGTDGLPAEFCKVFWENISDLLLNAINYGYEKGKLYHAKTRYNKVDI